MWRKLIAALLFAHPVHAETPGAALFLRGEGAEVAIGSGGTLRLPATRYSCAGCHGADGTGRNEGGTDFPPIRWSRLNTEYDADGIVRALRDGIAPDGRLLSQAMPRFVADATVITSLIAYLKTLDTEGRIGVTATEIRVQMTQDAAVNRGFAAAITVFNAEGGAFGRRIVIADGDTSLDLAAFDRDHAKRIGAACLTSALAAIREAGHITVQLTDPADDDTVYRLRSLGLTVDDTARAVLHNGGSNLGVPGLSHFGCIDKLGGQAANLVRDGGHVTLSVPDRAALSWATASQDSANAMRGYALGQLISRAALAVGRNLTIARLMEATRTVPIHHELIRFPADLGRSNQ